MENVLLIETYKIEAIVCDVNVFKKRQNVKCVDCVVLLHFFKIKVT
jgi:hypothetical protein